MPSLSICAILLTVFDFSAYVVNKHLIITAAEWREPGIGADATGQYVH